MDREIAMSSKPQSSTINDTIGTLIQEEKDRQIYE